MLCDDYRRIRMWKYALFCILVAFWQTVDNVDASCGSKECAEGTTCKSVGETWPYLPSLPCVKKVCTDSGDPSTRPSIKIRPECTAADGTCHPAGDNWPTDLPCLNYTCEYTSSYTLVTNVTGGCEANNRCYAEGEIFREDCEEKQCEVQRQGSSVTTRKLYKSRRHCKASDGSCHPIGDMWPSGRPCLNFTCESNNLDSATLIGGCYANGKCYADGETFQEDCRDMKCNILKLGIVVIPSKIFQGTQQCKAADGKCHPLGDVWPTKEPCLNYTCEKTGGTSVGINIYGGCAANGKCYADGETFLEDCSEMKCNLTRQGTEVKAIKTAQGTKYCTDKYGKCHPVGEMWPTGTPCLNYTCEMTGSNSSVVKIIGGCEANGNCYADGEKFSEDCNDMKCLLTTMQDKSVKPVKKLLKDNKQYNDNGTCRDQNVPWTEFLPDRCVRKTLIVNATGGWVIQQVYECRDKDGQCYKNSHKWKDPKTCTVRQCRINLINDVLSVKIIATSTGCRTSFGTCFSHKTYGFSHKVNGTLYKNCRCDIVDSDNYVIACGEIPSSESIFTNEF